MYNDDTWRKRSLWKCRVGPPLFTGIMTILLTCLGSRATATGRDKSGREVDIRKGDGL